MIADRFDAVLFDLDGTLADTAPDLIGALQQLRRESGLPPVDPAPLRAAASQGAPRILALGLAELDEAERAALRPRYLEIYAARCWRDSRSFDGIEACLARIESAGKRWGVVTNKVEQLARSVICQAGWESRAGCLVAGDSTPRPKPAADPVLAACRALGVAPARAAMVGDDRRDVEAGRAAGTFTVVAAWGYLPAGESPDDWGADRVADSPAELLAWLDVETSAAPA